MPAIELGLVDGDDLADEHIDAIEQTIEAACPAGTVAWTIRSTAPTGWLLLNGTTVVNAQSLYPDLWAVAPASWKSGASLLMPNIANKTMLGAGTTARGDTGGSNSRNIATANLPSHSHSIGHDHASFGTGWNLGSTGDSGQANVIQIDPSDNGTITDGELMVNVPNYTGNSGNTGSGAALDTTPAHLALNAMIKAH